MARGCWIMAHNLGVHGINEDIEKAPPRFPR